MIGGELIRARAMALLSRDQLGRDFFARGVAPKIIQTDTIRDLLAAYARIIRQTPEKRPASALPPVSVPTPPAKPSAPLGGLFAGAGNGGEQWSTIRFSKTANIARLARFGVKGWT